MKSRLLAFLFTTLFLGSAQSSELNEIVNFHAIGNDLYTAGQLLPEHINALSESEVKLVINLAVASEERNGSEGFLVTAKGINYVQIPVIWDNPTAADLALFFAVMDGREARKTLVHCFANYRASAFTYLYRVLRLGVDEVEARKDLEVVWNEEAFENSPQWRKFIDQQLASQ